MSLVGLPEAADAERQRMVQGGVCHRAAPKGLVAEIPSASGCGEQRSLPGTNVQWDEGRVNGLLGCHEIVMHQCHVLC